MLLSIVRFSDLIHGNWASHANACCGVSYEVFAGEEIDKRGGIAALVRIYRVRLYR